mmetsp:Transcript_797/g.1005  ORF Transcript_797/g.1005 Transcript_797/m.1005 type:complete len:102 (+) Transcript_797:2-307(+)
MAMARLKLLLMTRRCECAATTTRRPMPMQLGNENRTGSSLSKIILISEDNCFHVSGPSFGGIGVWALSHFQEAELAHRRIDQDRCGDYECGSDAEVHQERQ